MPRYSGHLICSKAGNVRFTKGASTRRDEIAVAFDFELPASLFERPIVQLRTRVDEVKPLIVTPDLRVHAQQLLEERFGVKVELAVPNGLNGLPLATYVRRNYPDITNCPKCVDCGTECPAGEICDMLADELGLPRPCHACSGEGRFPSPDGPSELCAMCGGTGCAKEGA